MAQLYCAEHPVAAVALCDRCKVLMCADCVKEGWYEGTDSYGIPKKKHFKPSDTSHVCYECCLNGDIKNGS